MGKAFSQSCQCISLTKCHLYAWLLVSVYRKLYYNLVGQTGLQTDQICGNILHVLSVNLSVPPDCMQTGIHPVFHQIQHENGLISGQHQYLSSEAPCFRGNIVRTKPF